MYAPPATYRATVSRLAELPVRTLLTGHEPVMDATGAAATLRIPDSGHSFAGNTNFEVVLTAIDDDGISTSTSITLYPEKAPLTVATEPAGLGVTLDGIAGTGTYDELVGFKRTVDAPSPQTVGGNRYVLDSWSDGATGAHTVTVAPGGTTVRAHFTLDRVAPQGLIAAYGFDEGNGGTLYDVSGHGHDGTISGAIWAGGGRHGGALQFDGVNDSVRIPDHNELDLTSAMTLEAWVRPSALGSIWRTVIFKEQAAHMTYALYAGAGDSRPTGQAYVGGQKDARAGSTLATNTWTHLAATYDGASLKLYVNGAVVRTLAVTGNMTVSTGPLKLGGNAIWSEWFAGLMDDVRIYNRALSAAEITGDMDTSVSVG
jgi:hypothetical protein